jgi:hypothetical protein
MKLLLSLALCKPALLFLLTALCPFALQKDVYLNNIKFFMRTLLTAACLLLLHLGFAQRVVDVSAENTKLSNQSPYVVNGSPFINEKYVRLVEGTPYFKAEWLKGVLVGETGQEYKDLLVRVDLITNEVHYQDQNGFEMVAVTPIKEIVLTDSTGNNFKLVHSTSFPKTASAIKQGWYQWLASGKATLYQFQTKGIGEIRPYGSATYEQHVSTTEKYLVLINDAFIEIKKPKDVPAILANKKKELEEWLKKKDDTRASLEDRFTAMIEYYNSLFVEQK